MGEFMKAIEGKKTYIFAALGAIVQGLVFAGTLTQEQANPILGFLGFGGIASLRAAVK